MKGNNVMVKDLLISKRMLGKVKSGPRPIQVPKSPLLTTFERWSDKKRKLYFPNEVAMTSKGLGNFHLDRNLFASMLASPMRCDRISRHRVPKDYLIQLKLKKLQPNLGKHRLKLCFGDRDSKGGKSSYVVNSSELLKENVRSANSWIPIPALMSNMRYYNISDVLVDKDSLTSDLSSELRVRLERELNKLPDNEKEATLEHWDIVVQSKPESNKPLEVVRVNSQVIVMLNVKFLDSEAPILKLQKNHELGLVLKIPKDKDLVKDLYRKLSSFTFPR